MKLKNLMSLFVIAVASTSLMGCSLDFFNPTTESTATTSTTTTGTATTSTTTTGTATTSTTTAGTATTSTTTAGTSTSVTGGTSSAGTGTTTASYSTLTPVTTPTQTQPNSQQSQTNTGTEIYSQDGITMSMARDGKVTLSTNMTGGYLLYANKCGKDSNSLDYPKYPDGQPISYFDADGKLTSSTTTNNTYVYTDDFSTWDRYGCGVSDTAMQDGTDLSKSQGLVSVPFTQEISNYSGIILTVNGTEDTTVEVDAVYAKPDGTYSNVVKHVFAKNIQTPKQLPQITVSEVEKTKDYVKLSIKANVVDSENDNSDALLALEIQAPASSDYFTLSGREAQEEYTIPLNGTYVFSIVSKNGVVNYTYKVTDLSNLGVLGSQDLSTKDVNDTTAPVLSFSGMPSSIPYGQTFKLHVDSSEVCTIKVNGTTYSDVNSIDYPISEDGTINFYVVDKNGNEATYPFTVNCYDNSSTKQEYKMDLKNFWTGKLGSGTITQ